jgi:hypothetical protein
LDTRSRRRRGLPCVSAWRRSGGARRGEYGRLDGVSACAPWAVGQQPCSNVSERTGRETGESPAQRGRPRSARPPRARMLSSAGTPVNGMRMISQLRAFDSWCYFILGGSVPCGRVSAEGATPAPRAHTTLSCSSVTDPATRPHARPGALTQAARPRARPPTGSYFLCKISQSRV